MLLKKIKLNFTLLLILILHALNTSASYSDLFKLDEKLLNSKFEALNTLEENINNNICFELNSIYNITNSAVLSCLYSAGEDIKQFEPGSFTLGMCCGVYGVAIVYLLHEDSKDHIRSGVWGYLTNQSFMYGSCIAYYILIAASNFYPYY